MRKWLVLAVGTLCSLAAPTRAETARVTGGEHEDFTRIVIQARDSQDWRFGRTIDGYELQLGDDVTDFDLSRAFEKIRRTRLNAVSRDPETGRLRLSMACACHAVAFECRRGDQQNPVTSCHRLDGRPGRKPGRADTIARSAGQHCGRGGIGLRLGRAAAFRQHERGRTTASA